MNKEKIAPLVLLVFVNTLAFAFVYPNIDLKERGFIITPAGQLTDSKGKVLVELKGFASNEVPSPKIVGKRLFWKRKDGESHLNFLMVTNLKSFKTEEVVRNIGGSFGISKNGRWLAYTEDNESGPRLILFDLKDSTRSKIFPPGSMEEAYQADQMDEGGIEVLGVSSNGDKIWFETNCIGGCVSLWLFQKLDNNLQLIDTESLGFNLDRLILETDHGWVAFFDDPFAGIFDTSDELEREQEKWVESKKQIFALNVFNRKKVKLGEFSGEVNFEKWNEAGIELTQDGKLIVIRNETFSKALE